MDHQITSLRANEDRLWDSHMEMAAIGSLPNGGCCRLALTDKDKQGRDLFVQWCKEAGCDVRIDKVGNIFARREGADPTRPPVLSGSHLDTQPHGGNFDGIFGVLAALEVIRSLNDADVKTIAPIEAVVWTNEEGVRYRPNHLGSRVFAGVSDIDEVLSTCDDVGITVGDELERIGYAGAFDSRGYTLDSYFEAHIEQGPILEIEDKIIGVVEKVQGLRWVQVIVTGQDAHAGTTPMNMRKDAVAATAEMIQELEKIGHADMPDSRVTVGNLVVEPNSPATVPGQVMFTADIRNPNIDVLNRQEIQLNDLVKEIAERRTLEVSIERIMDLPPLDFDAECVDIVRRCTNSLELSHIPMCSGAVHDACSISRVTPTAMIFVPCKDGISHNEAEYAAPEHLGAGCSVLLNSVLARTGVA
jgi:beta-ureidopropionase / N-carbamoyl-L-amino-acid hydrolase